MTIYERERNGRTVNPALALYSFWHGVLTGMLPEKRNGEGRLIGNIRLSVEGGWSGISFADEGPVDRPTISGHGMHLDHNGEFRLFPHHGYEQRRRTARNTFLGWSKWRGYNWFVDTAKAPELRSWAWEYGGPVKDWREPIHYMPESVLGMRNRYWDTSRPTLKLEWSDEFGWHMAFSRPGKRGTYGPEPIVKADFDRWEALRQKRYRLLERDEKVSTGEWSYEGRRLITAEERLDRQDEAVQVIMANLAVSQSARTTRLRRNREEDDQWQLPLGCP